jgi:AcrR family transcriptional regulator
MDRAMARPAYSNDERLRIEAEIREAALRCFGRMGYRASSMRAIASELGWSAPALYRYYQNKEGLIAAVRAEGFAELSQALAALRTLGCPSLEIIRKAMITYLEFARDRSNLYQLMYELDQGDVAEHSEVARNRKAAFAEAEGMAADFLAEAGAVRDANRMAHLFWIGAHGLAALAVANQLDLGQSFEELVEPVLDMVLGDNLLAAAGQRKGET